MRSVVFVAALAAVVGGVIAAIGSHHPVLGVVTFILGFGIAAGTHPFDGPPSYYEDGMIQ